MITIFSLWYNNKELKKDANIIDFNNKKKNFVNYLNLADVCS